MYDAVTRSTYEHLIKTAEAQLPQQLGVVLAKVASKHPAVRAAVTTTPIKEKTR